MGKSGPKPKPTALKLLAGTRADRINKSEPKPLEGIPEAPAHLVPVARAEWNRIVPILTRMRVLTQADGAAVGLYCEAFAQMMAANANVKKNGMLVMNSVGGFKINPCLTVANQSRAMVLKLLSEFGCTPSSRSRVTTAPEKEKDALAGFLARKPKS